MVMSRLVYCSRCRKPLAAQFDEGATGPLYCFVCERAEKASREQFERDAAEYRAAAHD